MLLGNGWYRGRLGYTNDRALYGDRLALLAQLEVTTTDGAVHVLATDGTWRARESEILADDLYDGQTTDLRLRDDADADVRRRGRSTPTSSRLVAAEGPPIRPTGRAAGPPGLDDHRPAGRSSTSGRTPSAGCACASAAWPPAPRSWSGTPRCSRTASWRPARCGRPRPPTLDPVRPRRGDPRALPHPARLPLRRGHRRARPASRGRRAGRRRVGPAPDRLVLQSSNDLLDRFHENVVWSTRGNFVDLPTDCPQRDERLGWTGDIQVFGPTATFLYDTAVCCAPGWRI